MQMATIAQNSQEYLLELLSKIQNNNLWEIITQNLFEQKDCHHLWRLEVYNRFAELNKNELDKNYYDWTLARTEWLQQNAYDIYFMTSLFSPDKQDSYILQDFINLLALTLQLFQGKQKCLRKIKHHYQNLKISNQPELQVIAGEFDIQCTYVNNNFWKLIDSLGYHKYKNQDKHNQCMNL